MRKILFVDDETLTLTDLQRRVFPLPNDWQIVVVTNGHAALEKLRAESFDVVVTDLHMRGSSGTHLLAEVSEHHPNLARIALSGNSDEKLDLKLRDLAHQYLAKPCKAELLKETLQRVCLLRDLLTNDALKRLIAQLPSLPVLPTLYVELTRELQSHDSSMQRIGQIIEQDVAMTAKILQVANSAFFGLKREVTHPRDAAMYLGVETLRTLVLSLQALSVFQPNKKLRVTPEALWSHSLQVGQLAKTIAKAEKQTQAVVDEAFTAGLLHEIGILILAAKLPQPYAVVESQMQQQGLSQIKAERTVFRVAHPEVGAYLLGLWGLPDSLVETVAFHHEPSRCRALAFSSLTAVHVADYLINASPEKEHNHAENTPLDEEYLASLGLRGHLPVWQELMMQKE